ncbi:hypothetical protein ACIQF6_00815 [Kitasatospora sp. NPDC092948]|uniref:hypothetical protein n=1 Tax=Kitasatospora sp. NPDC092948 TaxID=3364088 RepID=UPI003820DD9A
MSQTMFAEDTTAVIEAAERLLAGEQPTEAGASSDCADQRIATMSGGYTFC